MAGGLRAEGPSGREGWSRTILRPVGRFRPWRPTIAARVQMPIWARTVPVYAMGTLAAFRCFERAAVWWR